MKMKKEKFPQSKFHAKKKVDVSLYLDNRVLKNI